ncbi:MAG: hypothetical protein KAU94_07895 [Verrucomicrobia bacterium]|nr:hypothetical protein [Verrucomicrobiota bacterium]
MGRLADLMNQETSESEIFHTRLKGSFLKEYYDLRIGGALKQTQMIHSDKGISDEYEHPAQIEWREKCEETKRIWKHWRNASSLNKKSLSEKMPAARLPKPPNISNEERLLHIISVFRLLPIGTHPPEDVNISDILPRLPAR